MAFISRYCACCVLNRFSCVWLCVTPWIVAHQVPLSMGILQAGILEWIAMPSSRGSSCLSISEVLIFGQLLGWGKNQALAWFAAPSLMVACCHNPSEASKGSQDFMFRLALTIREDAMSLLPQYSCWSRSQIQAGSNKGKYNLGEREEREKEGRREGGKEKQRLRDLETQRNTQRQRETENSREKRHLDNHRESKLPC